MEQTKFIPKNELFYVPTQRIKEEKYSQNFVKLFKNALTKVYHFKDESKINQFSYPLNKNSPLKQISSHRKIDKKSKDHRFSTQISSESPLNIVTQRRRLVKQVMQQKKLGDVQQKRKSFISKRCKTLDTNQVKNYTNQLDEDKQKSMRNSRLRLPVKLRHAQTVNQERIIERFTSLPPLLLSPVNKQKMMSDFQIISQYRQLEAQYRSKQFLSVPIQISALCSPTTKRSQDQKLKDLNNQISKLTKNSIIRTKTRKLKNCFEDLSRKNKINSFNHAQSGKDKNNKQIEYLMEEEQILKSIWQERQKKLNYQHRRNYFDHQASQIELRFLKSKSGRKQKLNAKQPLDEYFQPWEIVDQRLKTNFNQSDMFQKTQTQQNIIVFNPSYRN